MALPPKAEVESIFSQLGHAVGEYNPNPSIEAAEGRAKIRELAKRLFLSTMTPGELGVQHCKDMTVLIAVRTSMKLGLVKALPTDGSISSTDLGKATGVDPSLIERMFRILVATGFIDQEGTDGAGNYKHSYFSRDYVDEMKPSTAALFQGMYDEYFKNTVHFDDYLTQNFQPPIPEPQSMFHNCYNWSNKMEGQSIWDTMATRPQRMAVFVNAFAGLDVIVPPTGGYFDFNQLAAGAEDPAERAEIVDIGGGNGRVLSEILKTSPNLDPKRCVLQDLEKVLAHAHSIKEQGVQMQVIDFYKEQPVKHAKAYYLRYIMHDHADPPAIEILKIIAASMAPDSRILIGEVIVPERITEANIDATVFDQILLAIGGKERTAKNFKEILNAAGLELETIHYVPGTVGGLLEGKLKR